LDLLMESDIRDEQAILIAEMQNALERLSRIHSSLTLLTKLENHEYEANTTVCISQLTRETLNSFEELIQLKSLTLTDDDSRKAVYVPLHPSLADLLLTNLIGNAIRHNVRRRGKKWPHPGQPDPEGLSWSIRAATSGADGRII
jgi:signal transduction histidine kinase